MSANLEAAKGLFLAEAATFALAEHMSRNDAKKLVGEADERSRQENRHFIDCLMVMTSAALDDRMAVRADAVQKGVWPPPGGLPHIETMQSEIYLPAPFSPLQ